MNELLTESCAVVSSVFAAILAQRMNQVVETKGKRKKRRWLVRKLILNRKLAPHNLVDMELRNSYPDDFKNLLRVSEDQFDFLLEHV
jgi:hypothetical protein